MNTLENQSVTTSESKIVSKVVIVILNAICLFEVIGFLYLSHIRGGDQAANMFAGMSAVAMLVSWLAWPVKK